MLLLHDRLAKVVSAEPKLYVPMLRFVGLPGIVVPLVVMVFVPAPVNVKAKIAPENTVVPAVQATLPFTDIDGDVPVANVTTPADTVQFKQAKEPVSVTV